MRIDPKGLRNQYSRMTTNELVRLAKLGGLTAEAQRTLEQELAQRGDFEAVAEASAAEEFVAEQMVGGVRGPDVERKLVTEGMDPAAANVIVRDAERQAAIDLRARGILFFVLGMLVTVITYIASEHVGLYAVAWGAMLFGIRDFWRGWGALHRK